MRRHTAASTASMLHLLYAQEHCYSLPTMPEAAWGMCSKRKDLTLRMKLYEGAFHGFAVRGDARDPKIQAARQDGELPLFACQCEQIQPKEVWLRCEIGMLQPVLQYNQNLAANKMQRLLPPRNTALLG